MLGFLNRDGAPVQQLEQTLQEANAGRRRLADRLGAAETAVREKRSSAEVMALANASDDELDRAEAAVRAAVDRVDILRAALAQMDERIAENEGKLEDARAQRNRELVAVELETMATAIEQAAPAFDAAALALVRAVSKNPISMTEANLFASRVNELRCNIAEAARLIHAEVVTAADRVRTGNARIAFRAERDDPVVDVQKLEAAERVSPDE